MTKRSRSKENNNQTWGKDFQHQLINTTAENNKTLELKVQQLEREL